MTEIDYQTKEAVFRFNLNELYWLRTKIPSNDGLYQEIQKAITDLQEATNG